MDLVRPDGRVVWLMKLMTLDLDALRPGDRLNLRDEIHDYLAVENLSETNAALRSFATKPQILRPVLSDLRRLFEAVADRKRARFRVRIKAVGVEPRADHLLYWFDTKLREIMLTFAIRDLDDLDEYTRVRRCQACRRIFLARRRDQLYCGRRCANAVAAQKYREKHRERRRLQAREYHRRKKARTQTGHDSRD